mmetsp:Transcript_23390/g.35003  ORF Transcript_23390/g.35003 Transcript_23390/m.35003 type:complete len:175 (+) Transcript_23390:326-850(+)
MDVADSLSLSLFEALRGLRDAVAPESAVATMGGANPATVDQDPDYDEFLLAYHNGDVEATALVIKAGGAPPRTREDYLKLLVRAERDKDAELVRRLADEALSKSAMVDNLVAKLPGMGRTKAQQMTRIQELIQQNQLVADDLQQAHDKAIKQRDQVRHILKRVTCTALGIDEES